MSTGFPSHAPAAYDCPFCAIVGGADNPPWTISTDVILRTDACTAWIGSRWWENNPGHVLVLPNEHVENMYALPQDLAGDVHEAARQIALAMKKEYDCPGISTRQHNEPAGYQDVWHYHLHVFPRYEDDNLYGSAWRETTATERRPYADLLRAALNEG